MPVTRRTNPQAAMLRRDMTRAERAMWFALRDRRLDGFKFRRQASMKAFVVDFLCLEARLVVEIDGGQHTPEFDAQRTATVEGAGFEIVRFWNNDVIGNLDGVLTTLIDRLRARTLTQPSSRGRGL